MNNKVYVGNIPYKLTEGELKEAFEKVGTVLSARIITDSASGRSKGFGFVEMETEDLARKAIEELNGLEVQGRPLRVSEARASRGRGPGGGAGRNRNFNGAGDKW